MRREGERSIVLRSSHLEGRTLFGKQRRSLPGLFRELKQLTVRYAKQETLDPLKSLGRFLAYGTLASFCLGIGFVLLSLALLRALQTETGDHLTNHLTWIPYIATFAGCIIIVLCAFYAIGAEKRRMNRRHQQRASAEREVEQIS